VGKKITAEIAEIYYKDFRCKKYFEYLIISAPSAVYRFFGQPRFWRREREWLTLQVWKQKSEGTRPFGPAPPSIAR
jgi:hypothetical protein